jgi:hypothetical protein
MNETMIITFTYEGKQRTANIREVKGDFETMFRVTLDDGYENTFLVAEDKPYHWYEQNTGYTELAQAVGRAIELSFF